MLNSTEMQPNRYQELCDLLTYAPDLKRIVREASLPISDRRLARLIRKCNAGQLSTTEDNELASILPALPGLRALRAQSRPGAVR